MPFAFRHTSFLGKNLPCVSWHNQHVPHQMSVCIRRNSGRRTSWKLFAASPIWSSSLACTCARWWVAWHRSALMVSDGDLPSPSLVRSFAASLLPCCCEATSRRLHTEKKLSWHFSRVLLICSLDRVFACLVPVESIQCVRWWRGLFSILPYGSTCCHSLVWLKHGENRLPLLPLGVTVFVWILCRFWGVVTQINWLSAAFALVWPFLGISFHRLPGASNLAHMSLRRPWPVNLCW